ncbi:MAG: Flp family type IVb pilin [Planctomycetota bacterium]
MAEKRPEGERRQSFWTRLARDEQGTTAVEYAVMLGLIIVAALVGIASVGTATFGLYNDSNGDLESAGFIDTP